jgi:hypothetical protein
MTYRRFYDSSGSAWEAWEVHPLAVERRVNAERRASTREEPSDRRSSPREFRLVIPRELSAGWLAVQGSTVKVRLTPIPDGWMRLSDAELAELVARSARSAQAAS